VGTEASVAEAAQRVKARGRIGMVGTFWQPTPIPTEVCVREIALIGALLYKCSAPNRTFVEVGKLLASHPDIAEVMISHRFPLEGAVEAFATARDRASGAIKVCFDV
jgi:threonine dehydrogenase-like Zn-dependent dehydrogenase